MQLYTWIITNKEFFKLFFTLVIGIICLTIVLKTHKLFRLSFHQGIRYFRNAFFFYGLAFVFRYVTGLMLNFAYEDFAMFTPIMTGAYEFFLIMAGFFLVYSLLWRNFEQTEYSFSSLFNSRVFVFYSLALIIALLDCLWNTYYFMFLSQIILFAFAAGMCLEKYWSQPNKSSFLKLYLMVILLNLTAWVLNFIVAAYFEWSTGGLIGTYVLNILVFVLFLYAVTSAMKP